MNLYWPECVPYKNLTKDNEVDEDRPPPTPQPENPHDTIEPNTTYGKALGAEYRVRRLAQVGT